MSTATEQETEDLASALRGYISARAAAFLLARKELRLGELDARALLLVAQEPGARPSLLRDHLGITSAAVTTLLDRLEQRDLVQREPDPDDRRATLVHATVDVSEEPWNSLCAFDDAVIEAGTTLDADEVRRAAVILSKLTHAAVDAV